MSGPYTQPLVYSFGQGRADGTAAMKDVLGGKGAGLAEMTTIGIPVPPGFTIASSLCLHYPEEHRRRCGVERDIDLPAEEMQALVRRFKDHVRAETGRDFPTSALDQLWGAIAAVFESWNTRRAIDYRKLHDIPDSMGTAVNVVAMVYGNLGEDSGTGVAFSRDPSTGARGLYGEYLLNAQGEDVVSGSRTPLPIATLKERLPASYQELDRVARTLERHFRDVQDMESTIERGTLYMLQTRRGQRSGHAAVRIACEMVDDRKSVV